MISIIMPVFNRATLMPRAISSVVNQDDKNWELIIVDDGSTDDSAEVAHRYLEDSRIKYIYKTNSGAAHSRNVGVATALSSRITFLDSDDEAGPLWIRRLSEKFDEGCQLVFCGLTKVDHEGKQIETLLPKTSSGIFLSGAYAMDKSLFDAAGGFDLSLPSNQHTQLSIQVKQIARKENFRIGLIEEPLVRIHIHKGNRIRNNYEAKYEGALAAYNSEVFGDWMKVSKARSRYEGIIAFNAYKLGKHREARDFALKAFRSDPGLKSLLRIIRYSLRIF